MANLAQFKALRKTLEKLRKKAEAQEAEIIVGYTQAYAVHVHENTEAKHKKGKSAKYLERPARQLSVEISQTVAKAVQNGASLKQALLIGAFRLLRESKKIVPIDTGALKTSGFVASAENLEKASAEALAKSQKLRTAKQNQEAE